MQKISRSREINVGGTDFRCTRALDTLPTTLNSTRVHRLHTLYNKYNVPVPDALRARLSTPEAEDIVQQDPVVQKTKAVSRSTRSEGSSLTRPVSTSASRTHRARIDSETRTCAALGISRKLSFRVTASDCASHSPSPRPRPHLSLTSPSPRPHPHLSLALTLTSPSPRPHPHLSPRASA